MEKTFGFIGTGNMGAALARAAVKEITPANVWLSNRTHAKAEVLAAELGCLAVHVRTVAEKCDYIFLGVKPQMMADLLSDIAPVLASREEPFVLICMAGGLTMDSIRKMAGSDYPVIRIMPNTPVSVGCGVILYDCTENVSHENIEDFCTAMAQAGLVDALPEKLIDAGSAVSGSGPAFADMFIEAIADGGVLCGLPRAKAMRYAAMMLQGAAKLYLEGDKHPGELKDAVCSPGGSTIVGVQELEKGGFRSACMEAVIKTYERSREMGK